MKECRFSIQDLYNSLLEKPKEVYQLFINYYEEQRVDLQNVISLEDLQNDVRFTEVRENLSTSSTSSDFESVLNQLRLILMSEPPEIYIYWADVRITNEYHKYVDIKDLWGLVQVNYDGTLWNKFHLNRSHYPISHMLNGYMHSHVCNIPTNDFTIFQECCTGRGPINDTMSSLRRAYNEDLWNLFCLELDKYVHVESVSGIPYHRLEYINVFPTIINIENNNIATTPIRVREDLKDSIREFINYAINNFDWKFTFVNNNYVLGMDKIEYILKLSNLFIKWHNKYNTANLSLSSYISSEILQQCKYNNRHFYIQNSTSRRHNYAAYEGSKVLTFKGTDILLKIDNTDDNLDNLLLILNPTIANTLLIQVLRTINYNYGKCKTESPGITRYI